MRVLFTGHGARGHVLPLLGLAAALVADGYDVLFATSPDLCALLASHGIETVAAGMTDEAMLAEAERRRPGTRSLPPADWTIRMFAEIAAPAMVADLGPVIDRWQPDVVVREEGEYGGAVAAALAGLPWVTHGWGSPAPAPEAVIELSRVVAPTWRGAGLRSPSGPGIYGAALFDPCPPSLYATPPPLEHRRMIRPWLPDPPAVPAERGSAGRRRAYLGFGTVSLFRHPSQLLLAAAAGLLALDFDVTVTTGSDEVGRRVRALDRDRVHVARWLDLRRLMPHCDLVVCHGGAGTVLIALAAGVPLLLLPRGAPSQLRMSAACEARGVGRVVAWSGTNEEELADALSDVASNEQMRGAAMAVASEIAAMPDPSTAIPLLLAIS